MGIVIRKEGFTTAGKVSLAIVNDLIANGFKAIFPVDGSGVFQPPTAPNLEKFIVILEATGDVDPLNKTEVAKKQPWRIAFNVTDNATLGLIVGSDVSLPSSGVLPYITGLITESGNTTTKIIGVRGVVGADYTPPKQQTSPVPYFPTAALVAPHWNNPTEGFINRRTKVWVGAVSVAVGPNETAPTYPTDPANDVSASYPMSYHISISPRGLFLSVWQGAATNMNGSDFSWILVQRPVVRDTGVVVTEGKAPVFCVNAVGNQINRLIVREADVLDASVSYLATVDSKDVTAIINEKRQVGVSENNQYIVNYPSRLNTSRYAYTYELDMIGYASATVVAGTTDIPQTLYSEATPRTYTGMHANLKDNNGMRIVALTSGGGIAPVTP